MNDPIRLEIGPSSVATLTFLGNDELNRFDVAMRDALIDALWTVEHHPDVRALVLRSGRRHFSAGADLREFGGAETVFEARRIRWDRDPFSPLAELAVPTVAALHGHAAGSGLELAMLCDIRIATPDTRLSLPEIRLGMLPGAGGSQSTPRLAGVPRALAMVLRGQTMAADEAQAWGLVHHLSPDPHQQAATIATELAQLPGAAVRAAKAALRAAADRPLAAGLRLERSLARHLRA